MDKIFELFENLNKHKKWNFVVDWIFYSSVIFLSGLPVLSWQYWAILVLVLIINTKKYIEGRQDQKVFEKKWRVFGYERF